MPYVAPRIAHHSSGANLIVAAIVHVAMTNQSDLWPIQHKLTEVGVEIAIHQQIAFIAFSHAGTAGCMMYDQHKLLVLLCFGDLADILQHGSMISQSIFRLQAAGIASTTDATTTVSAHLIVVHAL